MSLFFKITPLLVLLISCQLEGDLTHDHNSGLVLSDQAKLVYATTFTTTEGISGAGKAEIYSDRNQFKLRLVDYSIEDGPDLKVYLSQSNTPNSYINLGNLSRQQIYLLPEGVDFSVYTHVLIHCQQYNHLFAYGALIPQM